MSSPIMSSSAQCGYVAIRLFVDAVVAKRRHGQLALAQLAANKSLPNDWSSGLYAQ